MFWLRMHEWIAINLAGARLQNLRLQTLREAQHIDRAHAAGFRGLDGIVLVVDRRGRAGQIIDLVNLHIKRIDHIMTHQFEARVGQKMRDVAPAAGVEVIDTQHLMSVCEQPLAWKLPRNPSPLATTQRLTEKHLAISESSCLFQNH